MREARIEKDRGPESYGKQKKGANQMQTFAHGAEGIHQKACKWVRQLRTKMDNYLTGFEPGKEARELDGVSLYLLKKG